MATVTAPAENAVLTARHAITTRSEDGHLLTLDHLPHLHSLEDDMQTVAVKGAEEGYSMLADNIDRAKNVFPKKLLRHADKPLFFTLLLRPKISPQKTLSLSALVAVALSRVLRRSVDGTVSICWPNQIVCNGRPLSTFRMKCVLHPLDGTYQYVIVNIAIALSDAMEREPLSNSVAHVFGGTSDDFREHIALELLREIYSLYEKMEKNRAFIAEYRTLSLHKNATVVLRHPYRAVGVVRGIDDEGCLLVDLPNNQQITLYSTDAIRSLYLNKKASQKEQKKKANA